MKTLSHRYIAYRSTRSDLRDHLPFALAALGAVCVLAGWMVQSGSLELALLR